MLGGRTKREVALNEESALNEVVQYLHYTGLCLCKFSVHLVQSYSRYMIGIPLDIIQRDSSAQLDRVELDGRVSKDPRGNIMKMPT